MGLPVSPKFHFAKENNNAGGVPVVFTVYDQSTSVASVTAGANTFSNQYTPSTFNYSPLTLGQGNYYVSLTANVLNGKYMYKNGPITLRDASGTVLSSDYWSGSLAPAVSSAPISDNGSLTLTPTAAAPEPSQAMVMLGLVGVGLTYTAGRRFRSKAQLTD